MDPCLSAIRNKQFRGSPTLSPAAWRKPLGALLTTLAALVAAPVHAQEPGRITGRVVESGSGAPVGEVQVFIAGINLGTLSRQDGAFLILEVPAGTHEVRAERIGMAPATQEVTVTGGQTVRVDFELTTQALGLDEIVVTGAAGAARRREVGNSITQISPADLPTTPTRVADLLQSSAPGIEVSGVSGQVGGGTKIRLRGNNSMSQTNTPIIYVDGIRMQSQSFPEETFGDRRPRNSGITPSPINFINPNDIERIEVIKGAAATTLYGTEASAGVIQIFTKKGSAGTPVWSAEIQQGSLWMREFGPPAEPYMRMDPWLGTGHTQGYSASVRAGGDLIQYFVSGMYNNDTGVLPHNQSKVWAVRSNFSASPAEGLQFQWNSAYTNNQVETPQEGGSAEGVTLNAFRAERNYFGTADPAVISRTLDDWRINHAIDRFTTGGTVTYSPIANLTNRFTIGFDYSQSEIRNLRPVGGFFWPLGALYVSVFQDRYLTYDYVGTYRFDITDRLNSSFSWGGQAVGTERSTTGTWAEEFPGAALPTISSAAQTTGYETIQKVWNAGFFFQNIFGLNDRYFLTLGMRVDGNSAFGSGFGLQMYPKASATWVISDEGWWQDGWGQVKLRSAFGKSGRAPGAFDAVRTWQGQGFMGESAFTPRNVGNPDLGPEISSEFEVGLDGSWFNDRVNATFTYYDQTTSEALFDVAQIPSLGFLTGQRLNVGKIGNSGIELAVNASPFQSESWGLDVGLDVTTNHSEVLDLGGAPPFSVGGDSYVVEGYPAPVRRVRVVTNPDEIAPPEFENNVYLGPITPTLMWGLSTTVRLPAGISLSARGDYRGGHYYADGASSGAVSRSVRWPICFPYYVHPEGMVNGGPDTSIELRDDTPALWRARCTPSTGNDDMYTVPADYFRLRSLSVAVPVGFAFPDRVSTATLTAGVYNTWTWYNEDFLQWDPEMVGDPDGLVDEPGMRLPIPMSFRASLQIQF